MDFDERYLRGVEHFNKREFFEAHEAWEEFWNDSQGEPHRFVQGLIQFATALHHFEAHNLKGARLLYLGGIELLAPFKSIYMGLDVSQLVQQMSLCFSELLPYEQRDLPGRFHPDKEKFPIKLNNDLIPEIVINP